MPRRKEPETESLRLQLEIARLKEENQRLLQVNRMNEAALKEHSRLFRILKPSRIPINHDRKLYIAGEQLYKCKAIHGREKCPRWLLAEGSFGGEGFEIHHELEWSVGYQNAGTCVAICHSCHALASRLSRMKQMERGVEKEDEEEDE